MSEQAQRHQQGAAPQEGQALLCTPVDLPVGRGFESLLQGQVLRSTGPSCLLSCMPTPHSPVNCLG